MNVNKVMESLVYRIDQQEDYKKLEDILKSQKNCSNLLNSDAQPGNEYQKSNGKSCLQDELIGRLEDIQKKE